MLTYLKIEIRPSTATIGGLVLLANQANQVNLANHMAYHDIYISDI